MTKVTGVDVGVGSDRSVETPRGAILRSDGRCDIDRLGLSLRARNALVSGGIDSIKVLTAMPGWQLLVLRGFGRVCFDDVKAKLAAKGLSLVDNRERRGCLPIVEPDNNDHAGQLMNEWVLWSERKPKRLEVCDFVFKGDKGTPEVWMLCGALRGEVENHEDPVAWRPACELPEGVAWWEEGGPDVRGERSYEESYDDFEMLADIHCSRSGHDVEEAPVLGCAVCQGILLVKAEADGLKNVARGTLPPDTK